jgi:hypothetical protein
MELYILALLTLALAVLSFVLGRMLLYEKNARKNELSDTTARHASEIKGLFKDFESAKIDLLAEFQAEREKLIDAITRKEFGSPVFGEREPARAPQPAETALDRKQRIKRERDEQNLEELSTVHLEGMG